MMDVATGMAAKITPPLRVRLLDGLRGFSVVSMVAYHAMYDLVYMAGLRAPWYGGLPGYLWQQSICWVFILVAGASLHYGRRPWRHALVVLGGAAAVSLVSFVATPAFAIRFGVLHLLGLCMLLAAALRPLIKRVPAVPGLVVCGLLFVLLRGVPGGFIGLLDHPLVWLPRALYSTGLLFPLGLPGPGFASSDYFPLVPWMFLFFAGYFAWKLFGANAKPTPAGKNPLEWCGRHSLPIYLAHQPLLYALLVLPGWNFG